MPCAGHRINLCAEDIFKEKKIKIKNKNGSELFYVKEFNEEGRLLEKEIDLASVREIEVMNKIKGDLNAIIKKCKHLVGSFRHSDILMNKLRKVQYMVK